MKQLAQYQNGKLEWQEVDRPLAPPGGILVKLTHSVISPGTERHKVEVARMSLLAKARARPDQVRKVLQTARQLGWKAAWSKVRNRLESPSPLGYSASGVVVGVDPGNHRFSVGDRVACAGAECAHHAEFVAIPDMLAAPVPPKVRLRDAAFTTMAAIAMQAVRQADVRLGETVVVVGQGLVGLLVTALAKLSGGIVMGIDPDTARRDVALRMGAEQVAGSDEALALAHSLSGGKGVDHVILCVGGSSPVLTRQAVAMLRDRGRATVVGMLEATWEWKQTYGKEIEIRYARSYGPGRYDPDFEWAGHDYPLGYVRWTEQRHLDACLSLMAKGLLNVAPLVSQEAPFGNAPDLYDQLVKGGSAIGIVLCYGEGEKTKTHEVVPVVAPTRGKSPSGLGKKPRVDLIGAGNFARTMLLPFLVKRIEPGIVITKTPLTAKHVKGKFAFAGMGTDVDRCWGPDGAPAVIIATRHNLHATYVLEALKAGRSVFVEKPLCLNAEELAAIREVAAQSPGTLLVGFNRRFAPAALRLHEMIPRNRGPVSLQMTVNAGPLAPDHWYANYRESGGRLIGECCHFIDLALYLTESTPKSVVAFSLAGPGDRQDDAVQIQMRFEDGSSAQIAYHSRGNPTAPKEIVTVMAEGFVAECRDFQTLETWTGKGRKREAFRSKGHREEMEAWVKHLEEGGPPPVEEHATFLSMELVFAVMTSLRSGNVVELAQKESLARELSGAENSANETR